MKQFSGIHRRFKCHFIFFCLLQPFSTEIFRDNPEQTFSRFSRKRGGGQRQFAPRRRKRVSVCSSKKLFKSFRVARKPFAEEMLKSLSSPSLTLEDYKTKLQDISSVENYKQEITAHNFLRPGMVAEYICFLSSTGKKERQLFYLKFTKTLIQKQLELERANKMVLHTCAQGSHFFYSLNASFYHSRYEHASTYLERTSSTVFWNDSAVENNLSLVGMAHMETDRMVT